MVASLRLAALPDGNAAAQRDRAPLPAGRPIRVLLAGDHELVRRDLRLLLETYGDLEVLAETGAPARIAPHVHEGEPDVLVLDLRLHGGPSLDTVRTLSERARGTAIVVLSMEDNPVYAQRALTAGALAFVAKDRADQELAHAVRLAARGEQYVSPPVAARLDCLHRALTDNKLTSREIEVLQLIAFGHTNVETARRLRLSPRTIETHRAHIHRKLDLGTRAELVRYALRRGLIGA